MIRVLVAEDSIVQREVLVHLLEQAGGFKVVGTARDGEEAVAETARLKPDIILMDCFMPRLSGTEATKRIMEESPTPIVLVSATESVADVAFALNSMRAGALAALPKPSGTDDPADALRVRELVRTLRLMSEVRVIRRRPMRPAPAPPRPAPATAPGAPLRGMRIIAIAGSTGAPGVIADLLTGLAPLVTVPIVIVQHLAHGFADGFALWLAQRSGLRVKVADAGMSAEPGLALVAPDHAHMAIDPALRVRLSDEPAEEGFQPSANHLFRSVARSFGANAIGILLTGMGRDGAEGLLEMRKAGALTIAQDEESSVVFGMPGTAVRLGAALHVLPPAAMVRLVAANGTSGVAAS